ncbi:hypothetical protein BC827DRAFT_1159042 [Russula dissimulans]|nr:hypothetical protein BC827DRAFT_1159042 [Russula dissimulans]
MIGCVNVWNSAAAHELPKQAHEHFEQGRAGSGKTSGRTMRSLGGYFFLWCSAYTRQQGNVRLPVWESLEMETKEKREYQPSGAVQEKSDQQKFGAHDNMVSAIS